MSVGIGIGPVNWNARLCQPKPITCVRMMMTPRESDRALSLEEARRKFELPFDQDVQAELNVVQWEQSQGSEVYTFSHPEGSHDDRFWAICLAVFTSTESPAPGRGVVILPH